jgi:hypothetical protein
VSKSQLIPAFVAAAVLSPFIGAPLSASEIARTFRIRVGGESLRIVVPKTFEPLLPGSVYPNRRKPVEARRLPVAILDREAAPARDFLLERKFLVVERRSAAVAEILAALASLPEADSSLAVLIGFRNPASVPAGVRAVAILDPDLTSKSPGPSTPGAVALFFRTPARVPSADFTRVLQARFGPNVVEKWYRSMNGFPEQAYRDAAEWSAIAVAR